VPQAAQHSEVFLSAVQDISDIECRARSPICMCTHCRLPGFELLCPGPMRHAYLLPVVLLLLLLLAPALVLTCRPCPCLVVCHPSSSAPWLWQCSLQLWPLAWCASYLQ